MSLPNFNPQWSLPKPALILSVGLAGVGKTTHLKEISKAIPNCVLIDKDTFNTGLLGKEAHGGPHEMQGEYYNKHVKMPSYRVMIDFALLQMSLGKVAIIDGGVGGKLKSFFKAYLNMKDYPTKVIYFHCSAATQFQRVTLRNAARDHDKKGDAFAPYHQKHTAELLRDLEEIPHLKVDTENPAELHNNIKLILDYMLNQMQPRLAKDPLSIFRTSKPVLMDVKKTSLEPQVKFISDQKPDSLSIFFRSKPTVMSDDTYGLRNVLDSNSTLAYKR